MLKYIKQLAQVIAKQIGLMKEGDNAQAQELIDSTLTQLNVDEQFNLTNIPVQYHESIADLIKLKGQLNNDAELLNRAVTIYNNINREQQTFSMIRNEKINTIKSIITHL